MEEGCGHTFNELFVHANWHCKNDRPLVTSALEPALYAFLEEYCRGLKGVHCRGIGGTENHVHLVAQLEPFVTPGKVVGQIKGASSHEMNRRFGRGTLKWQRGYGLVSFAGLDLAGVLRYVAHQKQHHRDGTTRDKLEACGHDDGTDGDSDDDTEG